MRVIKEDGLPIKLWLDDIEDGAMAQVRNLARLPFAFRHIAIMPDAHQGYGMPIGGVLATRGVVIPNAVGVDIGCGMCAVRTPLTEISTGQLKAIMGLVREQIPVGFKRNVAKHNIPDGYYNHSVVSKNISNAQTSIGTLGGGNHFIEIQRGSDGYIWIMIHSGSRNLGKQVADHYNKIAVEINAKWHSIIPKKWELAFLPLDSKEGQDYIGEMNYCVAYALANRHSMIQTVWESFVAAADLNMGVPPDVINIAHNYAAMENHFNRNVMVHRKGATSARQGQEGIIPGSQGTKSYIVRGLGNQESFNSCSHGAGRRMGRKQAERELNLEAEVKCLNDQGILHAIRGIKDLDEAPGAYKDITKVMASQTDLVEMMVELTPLAVVKG